MKVVWHGHSCFEVKNNVTVIMDPHDGKSIGIRTPVVKADVLLISHDHFDHNCSRVVKGDFVTVKEPGERTEKGVKILGLPTFHDDKEGGKRGRNIIFKFEMEGVRFCHCGDVGHMLSAKQLKELSPVDVIFVPVGGVFTIDGTQARKMVNQLKPKIAVPMHFRVGGLSLSIQTADQFLEGLSKSKVLRVGNEVDFVPEELPSETEYWVFSP
ncbi:MAG: MBL fold metallo-hydrolase [Methanomassiliicoccales archaeon]|jgi:L-ascorbate metabolism protein UlaG (beta-lactamase superfamily)